MITATEFLTKYGLSGTSPLAGGLAYLLRDEFTDTLTAGNVNGTAATPGPGTRVVTDTGSDLALSGGNLVISGRTGAGDPGYWLDAITRAAGRLVVGHVNLDASPNRMYLGWDGNQAAGASASLSFLNVGSVFKISNVPLISITAGRDYYLAMVLRAGGSGAFAFVKEANAYPTWTLVWHNVVDNNDPLYPAISTQNTWNANDNSYDFIRVPDALWLPTPLVSDGFTDDNDTSLDAHATDGVAHPEGSAGGLGAGGSGLSWTEDAGAWDIQTNRANPDGAAIATVATGDADVLVDGIVNLGADANGAGLVLRYSGGDYWSVKINDTSNTIRLYEVNGGTTQRASAAIAIAQSTDYDVRAVAYGQTIDIYLDGNNKATYGAAALNETATSHGVIAEATVNRFDDFVCYTRDGFAQLDKY